MAQAIIWTTAKVEQTIEKLRLGMEVDMGCFYKNNIQLKDGDILFKHSRWEIEEFQKCAIDIVYFVEHYCKFLTDKGRALVDLRKFQKEILHDLGEIGEYDEEIEEWLPKYKDYILMASRQTGKTTTIAAFFAWYMCFHTDRNLAILANKEKTAIEIVDKVIQVFKGLPFFMKPGIVGIGKTGMTLDNGCQLMSQATTSTAQIGFTIHVLYADEFAHVAPNIVDDFWRSVYPTLSSSKVSQCIITSTPNGTTNLFYEIWDNAVKGKNTFKYKRVDYWEVPGHDEKWAAHVRANFGEERFAQEFELKFNSSSKLLLGTKESAFIKRIEQEYVFKDLEKTDLDEELYRSLKWRPDFDPNEGYNPLKNLFVISVDTGEGQDYDEDKDTDYNVLSIYQLELKSLVQLNRLRKDEYFLRNMFRLRQVGIYRDNLKDEEVAAKVARSVVFDQLGGDACILVLEMNFSGKFFLKIFQDHEEYFDDVVMRTYHTKPVPGEQPPRKKAGFKVGNDKEHFCKQGKKLIRDLSLIPNDTDTVLEFSSFGRDRKGKFKGIGTHDDTVMATLNIARLYEEPIYEDRLYDIFEVLEDSPHKRLINLFLERVEIDSDVDDDLFSALYGNEDNAPSDTIGMGTINEIFSYGENNRMRFNQPAQYDIRKR
jgi:hypothetical protein